MNQRRKSIAVPSSRAPAGRLRTAAFTLIELSIVLVIIGLIVGGVLVGQSLINAAAVRAQISQIEKYNTAVNTFRGKYGALPGDISASLVSQFGFTTVPTRAGTRGRGDGNGVIEGYDTTDAVASGFVQTGEPLFFWEDLSSNAGLIDGTFNTATDPQTCPTSYVLNSLPPAKLGSGSIYVYSRNGLNYFGISVVGFSAIICNDGYSYDNSYTDAPTLTVLHASSIDQKVDDGLPTSGNVQVQYIGSYASFTTSAFRAQFAAAPSPTTCYDTTSNQYSVTQNGGAGVNCTLSFRFQ